MDDDDAAQCGCNFPFIVRAGTLLSGALIIITGIICIIFFFISIASALKNPLAFCIFIYLVIFGFLLICAELDKPEVIVNNFAFFKGRWGRVMFMFFISSLCLSSGFSGSIGNFTNILLIISGFILLFTSILGTCYTVNHKATVEEGAGGGSSGGSVFRRKDNANANPVTAI